jgi:transcriptional regulator with XRE-family HTH domain
MYKIKEIAEILNVSDKSVRRYLNSYFSINNGAYEVSEKMLNILKNDYLGQSADNLRTGSDTENEFPIIEGFTEEEYQEYQKRLIEYPLLKDQIEYLKKDILYHRKSIESHNRQMELLLLSATNKKFIDDEN